MGERGLKGFVNWDFGGGGVSHRELKSYEKVCLPNNYLNFLVLDSEPVGFVYLYAYFKCCLYVYIWFAFIEHSAAFKMSDLPDIVNCACEEPAVFQYT